MNAKATAKPSHPHDKKPISFYNIFIDIKYLLVIVKPYSNYPELKSNNLEEHKPAFLTILHRECGALLSGNRLNSFDSAFLFRWASICLRACPANGAQPMSEASALAAASAVGITTGSSILARACPVSGAQPMSEASALAAANALGITLTTPPHVSQVAVSMLKTRFRRKKKSDV